jgi:glycerol-3-phosphate acyltransferase PlsX
LAPPPGSRSVADKITVAVDGMGGDNAPEIVVEGLAIAARKFPEVRFLLYGDAPKLEAILDPEIRDRCEIRHAGDVITNEMKPTLALRHRESSMRKAIDAVAEGEAQAIVSAGNTGALMATATIVIKMLPGISRPAIATCFPTLNGQTVMLDLGANIECDAENLVQFAVMGEAYARNVIGLEKPVVGILNVGAEDLKGSASVRKAGEILQNTGLPFKFYGFVEGDDLAKGTVDVIVTDGFTGNIALKTAEGTVKLFVHFLREALTSSWLTKLGALLLRPALNAFRRRLDPRLYNGAMLVGLNGICVKSHGGTDGLGFANALEVSVNLVRHKFNEGIREDIAYLAAEAPEPKAATAR